MEIKRKEKEKAKEIEEIYIPREKRQIIDDLRLFWAQNVTLLYKHCANFLDTTSDDKYLLINGLKSMINQEEIAMFKKKLELKHQC